MRMEAYTERDYNYIDDTYIIEFEDTENKFLPGKEYILYFDYQAPISLGQTGIYACLDPRFKKVYGKRLSQIKLIQDEELK